MTIDTETKAPDDIIDAAHYWHTRYAERDLDAKDLDAFIAWRDADPRHIAALARAELLWQRIDASDYPAALKEMAVEAYESSATPLPLEHEDTSTPVSTSRFSNWLPHAIAASLVFVIGIGLSVFLDLPLTQIWRGEPTAQAIVYSTERDATKYINLADGSRITLDAASKLSLLPSNERSATLVEGNAVFDVTRDPARPFTVDAGAAHIKVLGTRFDVRRRAGDTIIAVAEGQVAVTYDGIDSITSQTLEKGQEVTVSAQGISPIRKVYPAEFAAWKSGTIIYTDARLADIITDANRYMEAPITLASGVEDLRVSGTFDIRNRKRLLDDIADVLPVTVQANGNSPTIIAAR
ncbi:MAG: FecR domain-containing protein [Pseudomonadota bacterium]